MAVILVLDDRAYVRNVVAKCLSARGHECLEAADGEKALALAAARRPDVAVVDWRLPGKDGLRVFAELRHRQPAVQGVMITGHATIPLTVQAMRLGFSDVLEKPVKGPVLVAAVDRALLAASAAAESVTTFPAPAARWLAEAILVVARRDEDVRSLHEWATLLHARRGGLRTRCDATNVTAGAALLFGRALRVYRIVRRTTALPLDLVDFADRRTAEHFLTQAGLTSRSDCRRLSIDEFCATQQFVRDFLVLREVARLASDF